MAVYFVYRSNVGDPSEKWVRRFEADTVLEWFRSIWRPIPYDDSFPAENHATQLIGRYVYDFGGLFEGIAENGWAPPRNMAQLADYAAGALGREEMNHGPHHLQGLADDDETEMACYVFDDHYLARRPDRAAFLVHADWRLPDGAGSGGFKTRAPTRRLKPRGEGEGTTYLALLTFEDGCWLSDRMGGAYRLDGVRVPDLAGYLLAHDEPNDEDWPRELVNLGRAVREFAATAEPDERAFTESIRAGKDVAASWAAYLDWSQDQGRPAAGLHLLRAALTAADPIVLSWGRQPGLDLFHVGTHLAQTCKHLGTEQDGQQLFHQWIVFDDLWASAHPDLAQSLLRFAARWDVL